MEWSKNVKHVYQDPLVAQNYDKDRFTSFPGQLFDYLEKKAIERALNLDNRHVAVSTVLDIPCGTGRITEMLLEKGLHVTGADISPEMIEMARAKLSKFGNLVVLKQLDLDLLDLPDCSYDLVSCIRLFHHLKTKQRAAIMCELARVSKRYVLINVSFSSRFYRRRRQLKKMLGQAVSKTSSTWSEIGDEVRKAGLKIVGRHFVLPLISEDLIILLEKEHG